MDFSGEDQSLNFRLKLDFGIKKGHLRGIIIAGSKGMGWNGDESPNPG